MQGSLPAGTPTRIGGTVDPGAARTPSTPASTASTSTASSPAASFGVLRKTDDRLRQPLREKFVDIYEAFFTVIPTASRVLIWAPKRGKEVQVLEHRITEPRNVTVPNIGGLPFVQGQNPSRDHPHFWEELLLLKVNVGFLEACLRDTTTEQLLALRAPSPLS